LPQIVAGPVAIKIKDFETTILSRYSPLGTEIVAPSGADTIAAARAFEPEPGATSIVVVEEISSGNGSNGKSGMSSRSLSTACGKV
jgi:hypothetical protein